MVVMMDLDQTYPPQQQALVLLPVSTDNIMSFNVDVVVMTNDYHCHLRGRGQDILAVVSHQMLD